jgi:superfamily I DNA/RNA helicase
VLKNFKWLKVGTDLKALVDITPTAEQLPIISNPQNGITLIRGSAGSGKTTTALLMLKQLSSFWLRHRERNNNSDLVQILVLSFNSTLRGYISHLAKQQIESHSQVIIDVTTFGKWSKDLTGTQRILDYNQRNAILSSYGRSISLPHDFLCDEIEYCLGRFLTEDLDKYLSIKRVGRGISPRVEKTLRERLLNEVILPYNEYKKKNGLKDWNDMALELIEDPKENRYDIIIVDEAQDFYANQIRAFMHHAAEPSTIVFVVDSAQRIYPRGWNWREVGAQINPNRNFRLMENHRNTIEICRLAKPLLEGIDLGDDGSIPDLDSCKRHGAKPQLIKGAFSKQCEFAISKIKNQINLSKDSVAFVHPKGWFRYLRGQLDANDLLYVEMTRRKEWPEGDENVGLITMHSTKGLEFDHIFILGLNQETTPHVDKDGDTGWENLRRLLAMTITRARQTVTLGCKPNEESSLLSCLKSETYTDVSI